MAALNPRLCVVLGGLVALGLVPVVAVALGQPFYVNVVTRIMVFAIAAVSLDLILGYGGMVSFGHAVYLGIGCYAVGILGFYGITNGVAQFAVAILASAAAAAIIGVLSLRTRGVYFIMITLAFGQMFYYLCVSLNIFGGDDGMTIRRPSDLGAALNLKQPVTLYYLVFGVLLLFLWIGSHLVDSRFGMAVRGAKSNERRMAAMGFNVIRYKLAVFVISGTMCGVAGALFANLTLFASPALIHWSRSGEIIMMVIIGGVGTLFGPILGAVIYLVLEQTLSGITEHWQLVLGPLILFIVLFARGGLLGLVPERTRSARRGERLVG